MVYLHFPTNLTEEEHMLQAKYQKLRRKKKALQSLKAPSKSEMEKRTLSSKRPAEAKDAKEVAKKLLKSGAISAIQKPGEKGEKTTFKRSKGLERKLSSTTDRLSDRVSGYQPYSATHPDEEEPERKPKMKNLYDSFVSAREREERGQNESRDGRPEKPRQGNTVYVSGHSVTEEILRNAFQAFGAIANISMEIEKHCGFVTFNKMESAEKAISGMNGVVVSGIQLKVSLARRQPTIDPINQASSSAAWSTIAANQSQKGSHKDKRDMVTYDLDLF